MNENSLKTLEEAIDEYREILDDDEKAYAILYTPRDCHLLLVDKAGKFFDNDGEFMPQNVFEARIFNHKAELRWLNESDGRGKMAIISEKSFPDTVDTIRQIYLLWGESLGANNQIGWTKFATARIGSFYVPVQLEVGQTYARFTAVEYLRKYEDGNVAVVDERLTGIEGYDPKKENKNNG